MMKIPHAPVIVEEGRSPIILAMPHGGTHIPHEIAVHMNETGRAIADTDWHIDRLYEGLLPAATRVKATFSRYVIDANRGPEDLSLYPGQNTTGLCPITDFDGQPIYLAGQEPDEQAIQARIAACHQPYHAALAAQIARIKAEHGVVLLYDCHSIRSDIPFLFEDTLPHFNIGTNGGITCAEAFATAARESVANCQGYDWVENGRFKGGWTTRYYANRDANIHTLQMEIAQRAYMCEQPPDWAYDTERAAPTRRILANLLNKLEEVAYALRPAENQPKTDKNEHERSSS